MAADWIKMQKSLPEKPEVWAIAAALNLDSDTVVGKLFRVWSWFDEHTQDGSAERAIKSLLDNKVAAKGFCDAMISSGWMLQDEATISLPNFERHNSATAKVRACGAKRVAQHRQNKIGNADVTSGLIPKPTRKKVYERDGFACVYCGRKDGEYTPVESASDGELSIDHVIPKTRGGSNEISNLVTACMPCNNHKNNRTPEEAGLNWPTDVTGNRYGDVTSALPEKKREDININTKRKPQPKQIPEDFTLTTELIIYAGKQGVADRKTLEDFTEGFINSCKAKPYLYADFNAAWKTWFRRRDKNGRPNGGPNGQVNHQAKPNAFDRAKDKLAEWERNQTGSAVIDGEVVGSNA